MSENLWPDFAVEQTLRSPRGIIEAAGSGLEKKTRGLIGFTAFGAPLIKDNKVDAAFSLWAPSLSYHYPFLRAKFAVEPFYPVTLVADKMSEMVAKDENELTASLASIFNAPSTVETIQKLMSLAQQ